MARPTPTAVALLALLSAGALGEPARAGDRAGASPSLPGVSGDYKLVKSLEPEPEDPPSQGAQFKIGDVDVRVSGSIIVDIGVGSVRPPRR